MYRYKPQVDSVLHSLSSTKMFIFGKYNNNNTITSSLLLAHRPNVIQNTKRAPSYLTDKVTAPADLQSRAGLRSASTSKYQDSKDAYQIR